MKTAKYLSTLPALCALLLAGCKDKGDEIGGNSLYISSAPVTADLLIDPSTPTSSRAITVRVAQPLDAEVKATFEVRPDLAAQYNMRYYDNAQTLPEEYYDIPSLTTVIPKGAVSGEDVVVNFKDTDKLDRNRRYVLPVTLAGATNIPVLDGSRTVYFLFKGAALINVVADVKGVYFSVSWSATARPMVTGMRTITIEALLYSNNWDDGRGNPLSSVFGIEGQFLLRIGDADRPRNQLQLVNPGGNWPGPNVVDGLPVGEWVHIAVVYDGTTGERIYYKNGVVVAADMGARNSAFSLTSGCYVGYSWEPGRYIPGMISELRIWNVKRTAEQIAANPYFVQPDSEGLVAYWKFNDGTGKAIKDHSPNGTNLSALMDTSLPAAQQTDTPTWVGVELPPIE